MLRTHTKRYATPNTHKRAPRDVDDYEADHIAIDDDGFDSDDDM